MNTTTIFMPTISNANVDLEEKRIELNKRESPCTILTI